MTNEERVQEEVEVKEETQQTVEQDSVEEEAVEEVPTYIQVGEKQYKLDKTGRAQAEQISNILSWLSAYATPVFESLSNEEGDIVFNNIIDAISKISEAVSADALIELYVVVTGCSQEEAENHFDIVDLIEGVSALMENPRYKKVVDRFFSTVS